MSDELNIEIYVRYRLYGYIYLKNILLQDYLQLIQVFSYKLN